MGSCLPAGFHRITPLKRDDSWSSVHMSLWMSIAGVLAGTDLLGVEDRGVSTSIASSLFAVVGVETAWLAPPLAFFLGGIVVM